MSIYIIHKTDKVGIELNVYTCEQEIETLANILMLTNPNVKLSQGQIKNCPISCAYINAEYYYVARNLQQAAYAIRRARAEKNKRLAVFANCVYKLIELDNEQQADTVKTEEH